MTITREDKTIDVPTEWKDITLSRWQTGIRFARAHMPEGLLKEFDGGKRGEVSSAEIVRWKSDWVGHWIGFSFREMQELPMNDGKFTTGVSTLYESLAKFLSFPFGEVIESFEFKGITYKVAKSTLDAAGEKVPMGTANWGELSDAMHLHENVSLIGKGKEAALPMMLACLFKPDQEQSTEERAELFKELPMNIVLGACFFLMRLAVTLYRSSVLYSVEKESDTTSDGTPPPLVLRGKVYSEPTMTLETVMPTTSSHT